MSSLKFPTKNIQFLLYALNKLQPAKGRIKLYKIHYLIEREGHVKYDMPINQYPLGPVDYISINFCTENDLIRETVEEYFGYACYSISLTPQGKDYFDRECLPKIKRDEAKKADKIIEKYKNKTATEILNYVHEKYVDEFIDSTKTKETIAGVQKNVPVFINLVQKNLEKQSIESKDKFFSALGYLEHIEEILNDIKNVKDAVKRGQVLSTIKEVFSSLKESNYAPTSYALELLDYLDSYCEKEGICKSMANDDLSDIPEEERKRLAKAIAEIQIPPFS
ncbi:SocA family protein [Candidatus Micrarchaeota archaeon]|nr:SocA family protein [Candidatus Micrarchaeota archaeon]